MKAYMIRRGLTALSVDLEAHPRWVDESVPNSTSDPSAASFIYLARTGLSNSKIS